MMYVEIGKIISAKAEIRKSNQCGGMLGFLQKKSAKSEQQKIKKVQIAIFKIPLPILFPKQISLPTSRDQYIITPLKNMLYKQLIYSTELGESTLEIDVQLTLSVCVFIKLDRLESQCVCNLHSNEKQKMHQSAKIFTHTTMVN